MAISVQPKILYMAYRAVWKIRKLLQNFLELQNDALHKFVNKTANMNTKTLQFIHRVNGDGSKTAKIIKKVILLSVTLTFKRCGGGQYHLSMIFCCFFDRSPLTPWITAALNIYHSINEELQRYDTIRFYRPVFVRSKAGRSLQLSLSHGTRK